MVAAAAAGCTAGGCTGAAAAAVAVVAAAVAFVFVSAAAAAGAANVLLAVSATGHSSAFASWPLPAFSLPVHRLPWLASVKTKSTQK